jgi:hypothetical protein
MVCPVCEGEGCEECKEGQIDITECPLELITEDVWQVIRFAELYEKGLPPIAGGALEQAKVFVDAAQFIMNEKAYWKAKLGTGNW